MWVCLIWWIWVCAGDGCGFMPMVGLGCGFVWFGGCGFVWFGGCGFVPISLGFFFFF